MGQWMDFGYAQVPSREHNVSHECRKLQRASGRSRGFEKPQQGKYARICSCRTGCVARLIINICVTKSPRDVKPRNYIVPVDQYRARNLRLIPKLSGGDSRGGLAEESTEGL